MSYLRLHERKPAQRKGNFISMRIIMMLNNVLQEKGKELGVMEKGRLARKVEHMVLQEGHDPDRAMMTTLRKAVLRALDNWVA